MSEVPSPDPNSTGMYLRIETDADRTPEFKAARDQLLSTVDGFLNNVLRLQMQGTAMNGSAILRQPIITETDLGPTGPGTKLRATEASEGVSLTGDESRPLSLQYVRGDTIIRTKGSDPLLAVTGESPFGGSGSSVVASVYRQEGANYFGFDIKNNGGVAVKYMRPDGMHVTDTARNTDSLDMAQQGLQQIIDEVLPQQLQP